MVTDNISGGLPLLDFDDSLPAVIEPAKVLNKIDIPKHVVLCFFKEVIDKLVTEKKTKLVKNLHSEMGPNPIYEIDYFGKRIAVFHPGTGAPLAAGNMEEVIALGADKFIACGGAGVLKKDIVFGSIVIPDSVIRDEGTSYHYIKAGDELTASKEAIDALKKILNKHKCNYITGKSWTTDAIFRETPQKMELRRKQGCITVEMEVSAFFAVSMFRGVTFAQLLYAGDDISCEEWDPRRHLSRTEIREKIFWFAIEACIEL
jgi:uridine phosphorylase